MIYFIKRFISIILQDRYYYDNILEYDLYY